MLNGEYIVNLCMYLLEQHSESFDIWSAIILDLHRG